MAVKAYPELVSPFMQAKSLFHADRIRDLLEDRIPAPVTVEIDLADGFCNQACPHCFFGSAARRDPVFLRTKELKTVLSELREHGVRAVELVGGGEPTTHPDIAEIIKHASELGLDVGLVTNGMLLERVFPVAKSLTFVRISLDAAEASTYQVTHGSKGFERVMNNIRALSEHTPSERIGIGYLIVPENVGDIVQAARIVKALSCRFIQYRPATLSYRVPEDVWEEAYRQASLAITLYADESFQVFNAGIKWRHTTSERHFTRCYTCPLVGVITASGDIALCILKRRKAHEVIGNIYDGGFYSHWGSERHRKLINSININACPKPCKHDSYNIIAEGIRDKLFHDNFL